MCETYYLFWFAEVVNNELLQAFAMANTEYIFLKNNYGVGHNGVLHISQTCEGLRALNVMNCFRVSDASLVAIARQCPQLRVLNISFCNRITGKSVRAVAGLC